MAEVDLPEIPFYVPNDPANHTLSQCRRKLRDL